MKAVVVFRQEHERKVMQGRTTLYEVGSNLDHLVNSAFAAIEGVEFEASLVFGTGVNPAKIIGELYKGITMSPVVQQGIENWTGVWANEAQNEWVSK